MRWMFLLIFALTTVLVVMNIHQILPKFVADKERPKFIVYLGTLSCLGYLVLHLAYRVMIFAAQVQDMTYDDQSKPALRFTPKQTKS